MTIKFLVIAKNTGKGKVLTWVDYLTACFCGALKPVLCRQLCIASCRETAQGRRRGECNVWNNDGNIVGKLPKSGHQENQAEEWITVTRQTNK